MKKPSCSAIFVTFLIFLAAGFAHGAESSDGIFTTPLVSANLDTNAFTQWV